MGDSVKAKPVPGSPRGAIRLILIGLVVTALSVAGLILLPGAGSAPSIAESLPSPSSNPVFATPTPPRDVAIQRAFVAPLGPTTTPTPTPTTAATLPPPPKIQWTQEEEYALTWLCWYEIRGMGDRKIDACLSVISTIRARYAYANSGFSERDVISTITRPGQFTGVKIDTSKPAPDPDLLWAVHQYEAGARGSCSGYLYYDSLPGGPSLCVIHASNGQWEEFHNGWK